jgi:hypothetical protein
MERLYTQKSYSDLAKSGFYYARCAFNALKPLLDKDFNDFY